MSSTPESIVDIDQLEKEVETPKQPRKKSASAINTTTDGMPEPLDDGLGVLPNIEMSSDTPSAHARKPDLVDAEKRTKKFSEDLVNILSSKIGSIRLSQFMDKADEYPRFVWQNLLLSFQYFQSHCEDCDSNSLGNALRNFSFIIKSYPDILQRELLRDTFVLESKIRKEHRDLEKKIIKKREELQQRQLEEQARQSEDHEQDNAQLVAEGKRHSRRHYCELKEDVKQDRVQVQTELFSYGVLHAAVLSRRTEFVWLVSNPNIYRNDIFDILIEKLHTVSDSFKIIKRAVLWRDMQKVSGPNNKVSSFMKNFGKLRKVSEVEALKKFIEKTTTIDLDDEYHPDPWVVILAWSSVSKGLDHILRAFKEKRPHLFKNMITTLEDRRSPYAQFFAETREGDVLPKGGVLPPVERIISLLVCKRPGEGRDRLHTTLLQRSFLNRFSERTPESHWPPLHLAAASGDHRIVSILINSCKETLSSMRDQLSRKAVYIRKVKESFYDAKSMTPLHYAVLGNYRDVVERLTEWELFQPYVNAKDIFRRTALQLACSQQIRAPIVEHLMKSVPNVDVHTKDCCSFTPLHWAVYSLSSDAVKFLTSEGEKRIRVTEKDIHGRHPYDMAARGQTRPDTKDVEKSIRKGIEHQLLSSPALKDEVSRLYRDRQVYVDAANAILVGAALIASVTFGGWLQPPLGDHGGSTDNKVRVFWAFSSLSFFFAIGTVMAGATAVVPVDQYIKDSVEGIRRWLIITSFLLILSVACVLGAFAAAGFAALSLVPHLTTSMTITTSFGSVISGAIGVVFCYRLLRVHAVWKNMLKEEIEFLERVKLKIWKKLESFGLPFSQSCQFKLCTKDAVRKITKIIWEPSCQSCAFKLCTKDAARKIAKVICETKIRAFKSQSEALPVDLVAVSTTGVHDDLIEEEWERIHEARGWKTCPIRECYVRLEKLCLDEISNFKAADISDASWTPYNEMWRKLSQVGLFDTNKLIVLEEARNIPSTEQAANGT